MRITITGGTGRIGSALVARLRARRDAVVNLAGENVAQRWSAGAKRRIRMIPAAAAAHGFAFTHPTLEEALRDALRSS